MSQNNVIVPAQVGQYEINGTNTSECLQSATHLTYTHYANVCSGKEYDIPLGTSDIVGFSILLAIGLVITIGLLKIIFD